MKITAITPIIARFGNRPRVLVKVETDEGITGWGETYSIGPDLAVGPTVDYCFELIKGIDPRRIEFIMMKLLQQFRFPPGGIGLFELVARETLVLLPLAVIDRSTATAYITVVHAVLLLPMIVLGQVFLLSGSVSLRRLWQAGGSLTTESETSHPDTNDIEAPL